MNPEFVENAAVDSFVDGIRDWKVQSLVRMHSCKNITAALVCALKVEAPKVCCRARGNDGWYGQYCHVCTYVLLVMAVFSWKPHLVDTNCVYDPGGLYMYHVWTDRTMTKMVNFVSTYVVRAVHE